LFIAECGDAIRAAALAAGIAEREVFIVERGFKWDALEASASNFSLFGDRKLFDVRIPNGKPDATGAAFLTRYAESSEDSSNVLLVTLPRADKTMQNSAWFSALASHGTVVPVVTVEREALPKWIEQRAKKAGLTLAPDAISFLAASCEGNLLAARQEIEKLALLFPSNEDGSAKTVSLEEVESAISDVARFDVFQLSEAWLAGDAARAIQILKSLEEEGEAPTLIVWQFSEDIHALAAIRAETLHGMPTQQAVRNARVWGRRAGAMERANARVGNATIPKLLRRLSDLDALAKGLKFNMKQRDLWQALTDAVLLLAKK
jgi:DNA polymerase-3 subunit delta